MARRVLRCCWPYSNLILSAIFFGISVVTTSCGDFQDPAHGPSGGVTLISNPTEAGFPSGQQASQPNGSEQNGQTVPNTAPSSGTSGTVLSPNTSPMLRPVTFSWDPSQDAIGYKVYLIAASTSVQEIIDTGRATELYVGLRVGESYAFTVTAYNASGESRPPPFMYFYVS
jgi:hypothetical protein